MEGPVGMTRGIGVEIRNDLALRCGESGVATARQTSVVEREDAERVAPRGTG